MKTNEKWIEILTGNYKPMEEKFKKILKQSKCEVFAIMKFRRLLKKSGRGQDITLEQLKKCNIANEKVMIEVLQEMFLEPININHINLFYEKASQKYNSMIDAMEELYKRHKEDEYLRMMSIILTL